MFTCCFTFLGVDHRFRFKKPSTLLALDATLVSCVPHLSLLSRYVDVAKVVSWQGLILGGVPLPFQQSVMGGT